MLEKLKDKKAISQIKEDWRGLNIKGVQVASAPYHPYLVGRTVENADDLIGIMITTGLKATVLNPNINEERLLGALTFSRAFIASTSSEQVSNTFPKYLEVTVKESQVPIEQAIKRITSDPASYFDIKYRGVIKEKNIADLVIIGKSDYEVRQTILGGKVVGEETTKGEVLRHRK